MCEQTSSYVADVWSPETVVTVLDRAGMTVLDRLRVVMGQTDRRSELLVRLAELIRAEVLAASNDCPRTTTLVHQVPLRHANSIST